MASCPYVWVSPQGIKAQARPTRLVKSTPFGSHGFKFTSTSVHHHPNGEYQIWAEAVVDLVLSWRGGLPRHHKILIFFEHHGPNMVPNGVVILRIRIAGGLALTG